MTQDLFWGSGSQIEGPCLQLVFNTVSVILHLASMYMLSAQGRGSLPNGAPKGSVRGGVGVRGWREGGRAQVLPA